MVGLRYFWRALIRILLVNYPNSVMLLVYDQQGEEMGRPGSLQFFEGAQVGSRLVPAVCIGLTKLWAMLNCCYGSTHIAVLIAQSSSTKVLYLVNSFMKIRFYFK